MVPDKEGLLREACQFFLCAFATSFRRRASSVSIPFFRSRAAATALCLEVPVSPSCVMMLFDIRPPYEVVRRGDERRPLECCPNATLFRGGVPVAFASEPAFASDLSLGTGLPRFTGSLVSFGCLPPDKTTRRFGSSVSQSCSWSHFCPVSLRSREVTASAVGWMPLLLPSGKLAGVVVTFIDAAID